MISSLSACDRESGTMDAAGLGDGGLLASDGAQAGDGGLVETDGPQPGDGGGPVDGGGDGPILTPGAVCSSSGFCFEHPAKFGINLADVWGASATDAWAVGYGGALLHYDGTGWMVAKSPTTVNLRAVAGFSSTDVWAVGERGTALHYDGAAWAMVDVGAGTKDLFDVALVSADEVWILGSTFVRRRQAGAFVAMSPIFSPSLNGFLHVADATHVWIAAGGSAEMWNGTAWTFADLDVGSGSQSVTSLSGAGTSTLYACVSQELNPLRVWNGTQFVRPTLPEAVRVLALNTCAVRVQAGDDIWLFGDHGTGHFDGVTWTAVTTAIQPPIRAAWTSGTAGIAVGDEGRVLVRSGATWPVQNAGSGRGYSFAESIAVAAGVEWTSVGGALLRREGGTWTRLAHDKMEVGGLVAIDANHVWGVTTFSNASSVLYWNGTTLEPKAVSPAMYWMDQAWKNLDADELVFVGEQGITSYVAGTFTRLLTLNGFDWATDIDGVSGSDTWVSGFDGKAWRRQVGGSFAPVATGVTGDLRAVHVVSSSEVYLGGTEALRRWDGAAFVDVPVPQLGTGPGNYYEVRDIDGSLFSARGLWVLVAGGKVLELRAGQAPIIHPILFEGTSLRFTAADELVVVGFGESIVRKKF